MDNGEDRYLPEVAEKLEADIKKARDEGLAIIIAQHRPISTDNEADTAIESLDGGSVKNFYNGYLGSAKGGMSESTEKVYNLITSSADVIKAIVCGHEHIRYYTEIKATNGVIPQYVIRSAAYTEKAYGSKYSDYGCVTKIVFGGNTESIPAVTLAADTTADNKKVAPIDWWITTIEVPETDLGTYLRSDERGVRFSFEMNGLNGVSIGQNSERVMSNATITLNGVEYSLMDFGAIVSANAASPMENGAEGTKTVSAIKLNSIEDGKAAFSFAVPYIPTNEQQTFIRMRPYIIIDDGNDGEKILYGDVVQNTFGDCTEYNKEDSVEIEYSTNNVYLYGELGDVNGDGTVDICDLVRMKKHLADIVNCDEIGDMDNDGDITALDLTGLRKKLLGII